MIRFSYLRMLLIFPLLQSRYSYLWVFLLIGKSLPDPDQILIRSNPPGQATRSGPDSGHIKLSGRGTFHYYWSSTTHSTPPTPPTQSQGLLSQDLDQVDQLSIYCEINVLLGKNQYLNILPNSLARPYQTKVRNLM